MGGTQTAFPYSRSVLSLYISNGLQFLEVDALPLMREIQLASLAVIEGNVLHNGHYAICVSYALLAFEGLACCIDNHAIPAIIMRSHVACESNGVAVAAAFSVKSIQLCPQTLVCFRGSFPGIFHTTEGLQTIVKVSPLFLTADKVARSLAFPYEAFNLHVEMTGLRDCHSVPSLPASSLVRVVDC